MCYDFGLISGPLAAGAASSAAASGAASGAAAATAASTAAASAAAASAAAGTTFLGVSTATLANIGLASSLASSLIGGVGTIAQGQQQKKAFEANAKTQEMQARDAQRRGSIAEGAAREQSKMITGAVNARQGGSGVIAGQDTGADILAESAEYGARDAAALRVNGGREAWGLNIQAGYDRFQGQLGANAGVYRGGATFLTGISDAFSPAAPWWEKWKTKPYQP